MKRYTQKQLTAMVNYGMAKDLTRAGIDDYANLKKHEGYFDQIGYSAGVYGCNGLLIKGHKTGTIYAVTRRTTALFVFG